MSNDGLPSRDAPLAVRLSAAMDRAGYNQSRLARELGTNRRHVKRWLQGGEKGVKTIRSPEHLRNLPRVLGTSPDYFRERPIDPVSALYLLTKELEQRLADHEERIRRLEGR